MIWYFLILIIAAIVLYPKNGLLAYFSSKKENAKKINMENALKHIYDYRSKGMNCTTNSLAGNIGVSRDQAFEIATALSALGLIKIDNGQLRLTPEGKIDALRIIRIHRVLESYLADQTGLHETDWHKVAENKEHNYTNDEIEEIAAKIGNPLFDPHGDPIPLSSGEIIKKDGKSLLQLEENDAGRIIHLEDEPPAIFAQLSALGLYPGMQVKIIEKNNKKIVFEANGEECTLAPLFAENITVEVIEEHELIDSFETLSALRIDEEAEVFGISGSIRGLQRRRLMDFGIVPGTRIRYSMKSPSGDPTAYEVRGTLVAIREHQAQQIFIKRIEEGENADAA